MLSGKLREISAEHRSDLTNNVNKTDIKPCQRMTVAGYIRYDRLDHWVTTKENQNR